MHHLDSLCTEPDFSGGIIWCYSEKSAVPREKLTSLHKNVSFHEGVPQNFGNEHGKSELVKTLSECSLNLLRGNVKLTPCQKRKLRKHWVHLRKLADKRVSLTSKKKAIVQRGGFLLPLLGAVLPTIASLIFKQ